MNQIGYITLNISLGIYLIWFFPQILLNFKNKNIQGLSILMHGTLFIAYLCDLIYGFGLHMQWQYKAVTLAGLSSLAIQHYQFAHYGLQRRYDKSVYWILNLILLSLLSFAILNTQFNIHGRQFYDAAGMIANICWLTYMLPQIFYNYKNQSSHGLSVYFVILAIFLNLCDSTSAWMLQWDYPSKIGQAMALFGNSILLFQVFYYGMRNKPFSQLAIDS